MKSLKKNQKNDILLTHGNYLKFTFQCSQMKTLWKRGHSILLCNFPWLFSQPNGTTK